MGCHELSKANSSLIAIGRVCCCSVGAKREVATARPNSARKDGNPNPKRERAFCYSNTALLLLSVLGVPAAYRVRFFGKYCISSEPFALAVGILAGWLGHEASSKSKHTKALPTTCWVTV